jgi:UvrD-like helicase family protein
MREWPRRKALQVVACEGEIDDLLTFVQLTLRRSVLHYRDGSLNPDTPMGSLAKQTIHVPNFGRHSHGRRRRGPQPNLIEKSPVALHASIKVVESTTATAEAKMIATTIERIKRRTAGLRYAEFAVLYRTNAQSLPIQLQFILKDIPYSVREQDNILRNEALEKLLGVLRVKLAIERGTAPNASDAVLALKAYFQYLDQRKLSRLE